MYTRILIYCTISALAALCHGCKQDDFLLEQALESAGKNRSELETVIEHYKTDPLKLEAAKFLIRNMPGHYSYKDTLAVDSFYSKLDSLVHEMRESSHVSIQKAINQLYDSLKIAQLITIPDVKIIRADFLIDNIDKAFEQWENIPWCQNLDFEQFCEYILPYKSTELQSLRPWRDKYTPYYADSLTQMSRCSLFRISAFQATEVVNNCLKDHFERDAYDYKIPPLYYQSISRLKIPFGTCDELCQAGLNIFRSAGIPVAIDYVPLWGYGNRGHSWAVVRAPNGRDIPFVPIHMSPYVQHKVNETVSKAYRRTYSRNEELVELNKTETFVPTTFQNIFQKDVTTLYTETRDLTIDVADNSLKYVYLCTSSRSKWKPCAFAKVKSGKAQFNNIGKGCVYLLTAYDELNQQKPLSEPFKITRNGDYVPIIPNMDSTLNVTFYRKAPLLEYAWNTAVKIENGIIEASDNSQFKNTVIVGRVTAPADQAGEIKLKDNIGKFRYWRFIRNGDSASCYLGELTFFNNEENITSMGRPIGNCKWIPDSYEDGNRAFDNNVLTAISFTHPDNAWIGLDFGKPVNIDKIQYSPRSDGNMIEPGDEYELMYWNNKEWNSLGTKIATSVSINYNNIPSNAVYVLLNNSKGNSVRIFLIDKDGNQEWW